MKKGRNNGGTLCTVCTRQDNSFKSNEFFVVEGNIFRCICFSFSIDRGVSRGKTNFSVFGSLENMCNENNSCRISVDYNRGTHVIGRLDLGRTNFIPVGSTLF